MWSKSSLTGGPWSEIFHILFSLPDVVIRVNQLINEPITEQTIWQRRFSATRGWRLDCYGLSPGPTTATTAGAVVEVLVVYDPDHDLVVDVVPCENGHAQERALLTALAANAGFWAGLGDGPKFLCVGPAPADRRPARLLCDLGT